ncbi:MAG TPA: hypothetical protein P5048_01165 [Chlamydiales bacterium]|nr:hypothetical protein [Chlamydiales bacterium]
MSHGLEPLEQCQCLSVRKPEVFQTHHWQQVKVGVFSVFRTVCQDVSYIVGRRSAGAVGGNRGGDLIWRIIRVATVIFGVLQVFSLASSLLFKTLATAISVVLLSDLNTVAANRIREGSAILETDEQKFAYMAKVTENTRVLKYANSLFLKMLSNEKILLLVGRYL